MKKYRVRVKNSAFVFGEFSSKKEASIKLMEYINDVNKDLISEERSVGTEC